MEWYLHMSVKTTETTRLLELAKKTAHPSGEGFGGGKIHPEYLRRLWRKGVMERASRGIYRLVEAEYTAHLSLAEVAKRVPREDTWNHLHESTLLPQSQIGRASCRER